MDRDARERHSRPAGRARAPRPWASRRGVPAPSCRTGIEASAVFPVPLVAAEQEAWRRGGLERCATARLRSLLSCDAHCVCVPGAGLRTARTGQQGLAGLAEAWLQSCLRLKNRLVVTRAQGSGGGSCSVNCTAALPEPPAHREPLQAHLSELCPTPSPAQRRAQEPGSSGGALCG